MITISHHERNRHLNNYTKALTAVHTVNASQRPSNIFMSFLTFFIQNATNAFHAPYKEAPAGQTIYTIPCFSIFPAFLFSPFWQFIAVQQRFYLNLEVDRAVFN